MSLSILMSPNYQNTIVYKLKCLDPLVLDFYLGYTTRSLEHVSRMFKTRCKHDNMWKVCEFVRAHGGPENWGFLRLPIESCSSALEARIELRKHFNTTPPTLNVQLPTRTNKEYAQTKESQLKQKEYRDGHLERIHELQKAHYQKNKAKIMIQRKEYTINNRDKVNEYARLYRIRKKEEAAAALAATAVVSV